MRFFRLLRIITVLTLILSGCSAGNRTLIPVTPDTPDGLSGFDSIPGEVGAFPAAIWGEDIQSGAGVFGMYNLTLNVDDVSASLNPIRNAGVLGKVYQSDITSFLSSLCSNCLQVVGVGLTENGELEVTMRLKHPIPIPVDIGNPQPSDRLDLHLFDVRGIVILDGDHAFTGLVSDVNGDGTAEEELVCNPDMMVNADGYSTFFDTYIDANILPTASNLHPYKMFFEDPKQGNYRPDISPVNGWITLTAPQGQNVFPQGGRTDDVSYIFNVPSGQDINLLMVMDACYGHSALYSVKQGNVGSRINPRYFLPEFHRKEAWKSFVNVTNNNLAHGDTFSNATISVSIFDWQSGMIGGGLLNYFQSELNTIAETSEVASVEVFVPEIMNEPKTEPSNIIGGGIWTDPYVYTYVINNEKDPVEGEYYGIVAIRDTLAGSTSGPQGTTRDMGLVTITDFTNYQIFKISVQPGPTNYMPFCKVVTDPEPPVIPSGTQIQFDATGSYDPDGEIVTYEWDFDWMGEFMVDATGVTPPPHTYYARNPSLPDLYYAAMRARDNGDPAMECFVGVEIIVMPNAPPHAVATVDPSSPFSECDLVTLDATGSSDDDGTIDLYEWDFNYEPSNPNFVAEASGAIISRRFTAGTHNILLRVVDNSDLESYTRLKLISNPLQGMPGQPVFCDNFILNEEDSLNSHTSAGGGQRGAVTASSGAVVAFWVDEGDVMGGPAIRFSPSLDGGRTFSNIATVNSTLISGGVEDLEPTVTIDHANIVHLGYSDGDGKYYYMRSTPSGTFLDPVLVDQGERGFGGPAIIVDQEMNVNYFYTGESVSGNVPLKLAQSTDSGGSFNSPLVIAGDGKYPTVDRSDFGPVVLAFEGKNSGIGDLSDILVSYQRSGTQYYPPVRVTDSFPNDGLSTRPSVAVGLSGTIHLAWMDSRLGDANSDYDIFYSYSSTGLSYSTNVKVNDAQERPGEMILQEYPCLGIDFMERPIISWVDYRDGSGGDIYLSYILMPGSPFQTNVKINDDTSSPEQVTQGPPVMLISAGGGILIIWGDERNASSDLGTPFSGPADIYYTFGHLF
jgi:hypothetical protein